MTRITGTREVAIALEHVTKDYGGQRILADLSLELRAGEITILLGPSGCGKTTTLKLLNGLVTPSSGRITIEGRDLSTLDPVVLRRRIGYVIQEVGLFPHYRVFDNIALVPRLLGWDKGRIALRVREMLRLVNLSDELLDRFPRELSGGQRQRVGVARALAGNPEILLMDEPFGAVDPVNRAFIQDEFQRIQSQLGTTVVMVTHDLAEALKLGHRIAVFGVGRVAQFATPEVLLARPASGIVAEFLGRDRATRLLAVRTVGTALGFSGGRESPDRSWFSGAALTPDTPLSEALAQMALAGVQALPVTGPAGEEIGQLTLAAIFEAATDRSIARADG